MGKLICFDLRSLQIGHENRGIGMVIKSIIQHLDDKENKYIFYVFDKNNPINDMDIPSSISYEIITTPTINTSVKRLRDIVGTSKLLFHTFSSLKRLKPDIFVQFDFALGLPRWRNTKTYTMAYDLIPIIMKREYLPTMSFAYNRAFGKKAKIKAVIRSVYYQIRYGFYYNNYRRNDHIISISQATTRSFVDLLSIPLKKITTIPLAPVITNKSIEQNKVTKIKKPYIFYIGGTDSRKRVDHIVYAFNIIRGRGYDVRLVLAGNEFMDRRTVPDSRTRDAINASPYRNDITLLGFVTDAEKSALYKSAHAFLFCSMYEGFGLPIVEAMAHSCPVVAYDNSSITEASGNAAILVESGNYTSAARAVIDLFDNEVRTKNIKKGLNRASEFSWDKYTSKFLSTITR